MARLTTRKLATFAGILFIHISLLNLFFVSYYGVVFLWEQNLRISTLLLHIFTVLSACVMLLIINYFYKIIWEKRESK
ncbi:hypothetical protein E2K93_05555 [Thalassotalea sp. HSM 43]|uniref:hypothetical protein n=1 Tax=Thalassotalea sp. HSM 43 TaxID=2552945 RepID=UPI0010822490|nr:hypothetical protein [Thalassotalea sp. HSM 43]QBY03878.1 hypothetical protein E2K93_05555 [Thalassotalea sp. HSM 43]